MEQISTPANWEGKNEPSIIELIFIDTAIVSVCGGYCHVASKMKVGNA